MFGGKWGAFDTTGYQFFNPENPIYKGIAAIAKARTELMPLRYGRQYFREISGDGEHFGCPVDGKCTLAFSRILDTEEVLCVLNLDSTPRNDWVLTGISPGNKLVDAITGGAALEIVESPQGGAMVRVPLEPRQMKILVVKQ